MDRPVQTVLAFYLALLVSGCSFAFVDGPPRVPNEKYGQLPYFRCTEYTTLPVMDAVWGGVYVATIAASVADHDFSGGAAATAVGMGLLVAGVYGASSYVGFRRVSECRRAKKLWVEQRCRPDAESTSGTGSGTLLPLRYERLDGAERESGLRPTADAVPNQRHKSLCLDMQPAKPRLSPGAS